MSRRLLSSSGLNERPSRTPLRSVATAPCLARPERSSSTPLPVGDSSPGLDDRARVHTNRVPPKVKPLGQLEGYFHQLPPPLPRIRHCNAVREVVVPDLHGQ